MNVHDPDWVDKMLALPPMPVPAPAPRPVARPGSLWHSVASGRRGAVLWADATSVCLAFTDYAKHVYAAEAFKRLYRPV